MAATDGVRKRAAAAVQKQAQGRSEDENSETLRSNKALRVLGATNELDNVSSRNDQLLLAFITILAFLTRFYKIDEPSQVVFDEVHFGKFASFYLTRTYHFDVHPPLAKLMLAGMGFFLGYDGHYEFDSIGGDYIQENVPYIGLRSLPAALGALTVPFVYLIMRHSGFTKAAASLAALFTVFDNALVCQTRLILLDSMLMFFMFACIYCHVRFYKLRHHEFSPEWWGWLTATGVTMALTTSVKMVGLFLVGMIGVATLIDLWRLLDIKKGLTMAQFARHFRARILTLVIIPIIVYLFWFYIHFAVLIYSGPGDAFMSPAFQKTLHGSTMHAKAIDLYNYDVVEMKHKYTKVFLHSHPDRYPLRYEDGRVSSQGQQVTGYPHKDANNHWQFQLQNRANGDKFGPVDETIQRDKRPLLKHLDVVRVRHVLTGTYLLTHDVASPLMPTNQEFTTWAANDTLRFNDTLFTIEINDGKDGHTFQSSADYFRLVHVPTRVALWTHTKALPEWAFKQNEVNGNKNIKDKTTLWFVDEVKGVNETEVLMKAGTQKKSGPEHMNFFKKFFELQGLMISHNAGLTKPHPYSSHPVVWPLIVRGISFWTLNDTKRQIYLIGNPFGWWLAAVFTLALVGVLASDHVASRRGVDLLERVMRNRLYMSGGFIFLGWALHYLPFFLMGRMLFLHHYMPALILDYMIAAMFFQFVFTNGVDYPVSPPPSSFVLSASSPKLGKSSNSSSHLAVQRFRSGRPAIIAASLLVALQVLAFVYFAPITYSTPGLDVESVKQRQWLSSWDFHFAK